MAIKYIKTQTYSYTATFTSSRSWTNEDGTQLMIVHYIRGNPYERLGSPPQYAGQFFTKLEQLGVGEPVDATGEMFYLFNPAGGTNDLIFYQGTTGDGGTVQYIHATVVTLSASAGHWIEFDSYTGSVDLASTDPSISVTASEGGFVFNRVESDLSAIVSTTGNQTYISRSDWGGYTGYWAYAIPDADGIITFNWSGLSTSDSVNMIVSFKEVAPVKWSLGLIQDD